MMYPAYLMPTRFGPYSTRPSELPHVRGSANRSRADPIFRVVRSRVYVAATQLKQKLKYLSSDFNREISALLMSRE